MATYADVIELGRRRLGVTIQSCWIADIKRKNGVEMRPSHNRKDPYHPIKPCPTKWEPGVTAIMREFGLI